MPELVDEMLNRMSGKKYKKLNQWNINTLRQFDKSNKRKNNTIQTRDDHLKILFNFSIDVNKTFRQMKRSDINKYFDELDLLPSTINQRCIIISKFFKWYYDKEKPEVIKDLHSNKNAYDKKIKPSELITDKEVKKLISVADNSRNKAFVATISDSGARIGELLSMSIKDVNFEGDTCYIFLPYSKTEKRRVGLIFAVPYLQEWLDNYPSNLKKPDSPLWISLSPRSYGCRLANNSTFDMLNKLKRRAGIKKKINHHIFRHSRISKCRKAGLPDALNRRRHGLAPGSRVIERYTHIDDEETHNGYLKAMGYEPKKPVKEDSEILKPKKCVRCGTANPATSRYCRKCYCSLDYEAVERDLDILEMSKTKFGKGWHMDTILANYRHCKSETNYMERLLDCFNGNSKIKTSKVRKELGLSDDEAIEFLQYLVSAEQISFNGDMIHLKDKGEFKRFISLQKRYLEVNED